MVHQADASLECLLVPHAGLLNVAHAIVDDSEVEVRLLELILENGPDLRVLNGESLLRNSQQVLLNTVLVAIHGLVVVLDLHEDRCQIEVCLDIVVVVAQCLLIYFSQLRNDLQRNVLIAELPDLILVRILRGKQVAWRLRNFRLFGLKLEAVGDAVVRVNIHAIILLVLRQIEIQGLLHFQYLLVNFLSLLIFAFFEKQAICLNKHFLYIPWLWNLHF